MAGKARYAGIEIDFSANYSDLVESIRKIDKESKQLTKNLTATQQALKFDPDNIELAALNQKNLANSIENVTERLRLLKEAEKEVDEGFASGKIKADGYAQFKTEVAKAIATLEDLKSQENAQLQELNRLKDKLGEAETALKGYNEALKENKASSDGVSGEALNAKIEDTSKRIEIYKQKIADLVERERALREEQGELENSTEDLSEAEKKAAAAAKEMSDGYSATKAVIADLASTAIKKTASALIDFSKDAIEAASSLYEVENVVDVAFEDMRGKVDDFSASAIEYYGISELTAKRTASLFAAMGKGMDLTLDKATDMGIGLAKRSADMASFYDISQEITSTALKSVFTGETESLKRFGVVMTEVNLQQYALSQGIQKSIKEMTQAEKVQLRYNYLMQQTASAEGDFARTSDSFANKTRQLKERLTETGIAIGERFIKNLDGAFTTIDKLLEKVNEAAENGELDDTIKDVSDILKNLLFILSALGGVLVKFPKFTTTAATGFMAMKTAATKLKDAEKYAAALGKTTKESAAEVSNLVKVNNGLRGGVTLWAGIASAAISAGLALKDYIDEQAEALRNQKLLNDELQAEVDVTAELEQATKDNVKSRLDSIDAIKAEYEAYSDQAERLIELSQKAEKTNEDLAEMTSLADQLNSSMQGLGLEVDSTTGSINMQGKELLNLIDSYEKYTQTQAAQAALTETLKEQYELQAKYNSLNNKRLELGEKIEKLQKDRIVSQERINELEEESKGDPEKFKILYENEYNGELRRLEDELTAVNQQLQNTGNALNITENAVKELNGLNDEAKGEYDVIQDRINKVNEALKEQAEALKELETAYSDAGSKISSYKSEISELTKLQTELAEGTEMSTLEMLDMIEKYPELIGQIKKTENGYTLEKEALEELIQARLINLKLAAQERQAAAEALFYENNGSKGQLESIQKLVDNGSIKDISSLAGKQYTDGLYEAIENYAYQKGLDSLLSDIVSDGFKEGAKATEEASKSSSKAEKATIAEAETLITALEHKYKQGKISAETYYNDLDSIANEYYGKVGGYLERYMELEDEAQAGIKKAIEDKAKSYQDLAGKIETVIDAEKELNGIESNKNVLGYDEARGFRLESDQSALASASKTLAEAQRELMLSLADMSGNSGIYGAYGDKLAEETGKVLRKILPDLTDAYSEAAYLEEKVPTQKNYTFNFGDIKTSGDAKEFINMLNSFVSAVINDTQII